MIEIDLSGRCAPIPRGTWQGPVIPKMIDALLRGEPESADEAYKQWLEITATTVEDRTFPIEDAEILIARGRPELARLLISHGMLASNPSVTEPFYAV